jgi:hypothetical protein
MLDCYRQLSRVSTDLAQITRAHSDINSIFISAKDRYMKMIVDLEFVSDNIMLNEKVTELGNAGYQNS